jgi:hypothetical protein
MLGTKCSFPFPVVLRSGKERFDFLPVGVAFARVSGRSSAGIRWCWGSDFLNFGEGDCVRSCTHGAAIWGIFANLFVVPHARVVFRWFGFGDDSLPR